MKAKISSTGKNFLKNSKASYALVQAIIANPKEFSNGEPVKVGNTNGSDAISVKKVNSMNFTK